MLVCLPCCCSPITEVLAIVLSARHMLEQNLFTRSAFAACFLSVHIFKAAALLFDMLASEELHTTTPLLVFCNKGDLATSAKSSDRVQGLLEREIDALRKVNYGLVSSMYGRLLLCIHSYFTRRERQTRRSRSNYATLVEMAYFDLYILLPPYTGTVKSSLIL